MQKDCWRRIVNKNRSRWRLKEEYQKNNTTEKLTHEFTYNNNQQLKNVVAKDNNNSTIGKAAFEYYLATYTSKLHFFYSNIRN